MKDLFIQGPFQGNSGIELQYKIEADALSDDSIKVLAHIIGVTQTFRSIHSVPRGGDRLARALLPYMSTEGVDLIVDDVLTTGGSMERKKREIGGEPMGIVIIARGECPYWVKAILTVEPWARL